MVNYESTISQALSDLGKDCKIEKDPYDKIDKILENKENFLHLPFLAICEDKLYMFSPFSSEDFTEHQLAEEIENAQYLLNYLKEKGKSAIVFFITSTNRDVEKLELQNLSNDFGILHTESEKPLLEFPPIGKVFTKKTKLLPSILEYLSNCENLQGKIGNQIRIFSKYYLNSKLDLVNEENMIRDFMEQILTCDDRFALPSGPINFMAKFERMMGEGNPDSTRDHYFHAFNTMMLGFMVIDKFYDKFLSLSKRNGDDIFLEYIWMLTSLYHDIGHPSLLQPEVFGNCYGLDEMDSKVIEECMKQGRQNIWDSKYSFTVQILDDLFSHKIANKPGKWTYDAFHHINQPSRFKDILKNAFVEKGAHGVTGSLILALEINPLMKDQTTAQDREFLYRHIMLASISLLFHDYEVRECFGTPSSIIIKAEDFPLALLLTYVNILQDDRRDLTCSSSSPDIFKGICAGTNPEHIVATLNVAALNDSIKMKLREQLIGALSFFTMNGLTFDIPHELL